MRLEKEIIKQFALAMVQFLAYAALFFAIGYFCCGCEDRLDYVVTPNCTDDEYDLINEAAADLNDVIGEEAVAVVGVGVTEATGLPEIKCHETMQGWRIGNAEYRGRVHIFIHDVDRVSKKIGETYDEVFRHAILHELANAVAVCPDTEEDGHIMSGAYALGVFEYTEEDKERIRTAYWGGV